jgi:DNA gyrase subunit A
MEMPEPVDDLVLRTIDLTPELDRAYRLYAAKTIEDRALPDVRDGCKPVQRRILYAMHDMGLTSTSPHRKCARIVGEVLGKYHPHGDQSVYGSLVRLAQGFSLRDPVVDGQGNFGSIDGDSAAAMRYTEARLTPLGDAMMQDIDADTVDMVDNFDSSLTEPSVLPTSFPNLLVNGSTGIAVGMATNVPPHNLGEVAAAIAHVVRNWSRREALTTQELMEHVPGPDFPTGGVVYRYRDVGGEVRDTIFEAYDTGRGQIVTQARMHVEDVAGGKSHIVVTELPYMVQTSTVLERIAREVKDGHINGVTDLRDESDYDKGMRIVVELARGARTDAVMADLLRYSQLRETFGCNNLALVPAAGASGVRPVRLSLRQLLTGFVDFRLEVITRRTRHELKRRQERLHLVQGLLKALANIDRVVEIIRHSRTVETASSNLQRELRLSEAQARAILDMPLRRLTALETSKLQEEQAELTKRIRYLEGLLASEAQRLDVVVEETQALRDRFASPRRTVIIDSPETLGGAKVVTESDLRVPEGRQVVLVTTGGLERRPLEGFRYARTDGLTSRATTSQLAQARLDPTDTVLGSTTSASFPPRPRSR